MRYDIKLLPDEAVRLLELGTEMEDELAGVVQETARLLVPEADRRIYPLDRLTADSFVAAGTEFRCGAKIARALAGSEAVAVVLATVGHGVSERVARYNRDYDFLKAYWCDKLANWALDRLVELLKADIAAGCAGDGQRITSHWGPGYCGWDIGAAETAGPGSCGDTGHPPVVIHADAAREVVERCGGNRQECGV